MLTDWLRHPRKISATLLGPDPSVRVAFRYLVDHASTKRDVRRRAEAQRTFWHRPGKPSFAHVTLYATGNAGDNALSECVRVLFERFLGELDWQLIPIFAPVGDSLLQTLRQTSGIVVGGHGAFLPDTHPNDISGWEWACPANSYPLVTPPLFVFAIGYNYFSGQVRTSLFEDNVAALARRADFFGLRNNGSVREIQSFLPPRLHEKIVFQPCPTMVARQLFRDLPPKTATGKIAFNVALDRAEKRMGSHAETISVQIARAAKMLASRGFEIHFLTHCDREIRFLDFLSRERVPHVYHHATVWDTRKLLRFYNGMDMVIGMRGHGIWLPFGVNCHFLALGNQLKTKWFLEDIDAPDWNIDILRDPEMLSNQIVRKFEDIHLADPAKTTRRLLEAQQKLWSITTRNMNTISEIWKQANSHISHGNKERRQ